MERRLAAIMAADVVGYSRLIRADEEGTIAALQALRADFIDPKIAEHHGRIVKLMGDGMLAEFASVVDAVRAAVAAQQAVGEQNSSLPEGKRIEFRVGINLGDVVIDGDDIQGDGVNVASRLEGLAAPGGICISDGVYDQVRDRIDVPFRDLGEQVVKNIERPVRVWQWLLNASAAATKKNAAAPLPLHSKPSIAVLPFNNLSGDPDQEYFADGLTEDLITALSMWRLFPVIARNSTFAYKGTSHDVRKVAEELGTQYVLEGSVRKSGARVRITGQLIDAANGHHIWAEKYDRDLIDIFDLQDEISRQIVATIEPAMAKAEQHRSRQKNQVDLDAWDLYQRGMSLLDKLSRDGNGEARALFEKALAIDGNYGPALGALAYSYARDLLLEFTDDRDAWAKHSLEAAQAAVVADTEDPFAHLMVAIAQMWPGKFDLAIASASRAVLLNPSSAFAHGILGTALDNDGRSAEGIKEIELAIKLSPRDPQNSIMTNTLARAHLNMRDYDAAAHWAGEAIKLNDGLPHAHYLMASAQGHLGRLQESQASAQKCEDLQSGFVERRGNWQPYRNPDDNNHIHEGLRKGLREYDM